MKKVLIIFGKLVIVFFALVLISALIFYIVRSGQASGRYEQLGAEVTVLSKDGQSFRDLNKNGRLDIYEDIRQPIDARVTDLLSQMTIEEKAGTMFITMIGMTSNGEPIDTPVISSDPLNMMMSVLFPTSSEMLVERRMNSFNIVQAYDVGVMATFHNTLQKIGERTRLGIPITIASDPRHGTENNPGASVFTPIFSQWPSPLGLSATRDTVLVRDFGNIARQEYLAIGIRLALHPMADLATEPRWGRTNGTFGEDAVVSAMMTKAYIKGFQGDSLSTNSVACMTKHFSGGGPQKDGEDAHFPYGKEQIYPGNHFDYHIIPFTQGAFKANTAQIMPYYGIPVDQTEENVAFGFNKTIITKMLRDSLQFDGVICTDWNIISKGALGDPRAWGVENLNEKERIQKVIDAGCDQFGGEIATHLIVELISEGKITETRIDQSVRRILRDKFRLGLFDDPYVDIQRAENVVGNKEFRDKGKIAQARSTVVLKNEAVLPLKKGTRIYAKGMLIPEAINTLGELVDDPEDADIIVLRLNTPFEERTDYFLEAFFHQGRLYYTEKEMNSIKTLVNQKPTIVIANLERPAILTEINEISKALLVEFGLSDEVLVNVLFGVTKPEGKLPFELPSSWDAVLGQLPDVPYDSKNPLYPFGYGLSY